MTYRFSCGAPDWEFDVTTADAEEVLRIVRQRTHERHDRDVVAIRSPLSETTGLIR